MSSLKNVRPVHSLTSNLRGKLEVEPCTRRYAFRTAKDVIVQECTSCTFLNFEFALQTRFFCEPLTSCQSSEFAARKLTSKHWQGWQCLDIAEGQRRISFFPFVFRYAAVLEQERKNLPPMMQEREKDWSRRPVFALFELLLLQWLKQCKKPPKYWHTNVKNWN